MRWEGNRESDNVEDRRSSSGGLGGFGGRSIGIGTIVVALIGGWVLGINPLTLLGVLSGGGAPAQVQQGPAQRPPADDTTARFVSTVLADTEDVWTDLFRQQGGSYRDPHLVLFRGATPTACGTGQAANRPRNSSPPSSGTISTATSRTIGRREVRSFFFVSLMRSSNGPTEPIIGCQNRRWNQRQASSRGPAPRRRHAHPERNAKPHPAREGRLVDHHQPHDPGAGKEHQGPPVPHHGRLHGGERQHEGDGEGAQGRTGRMAEEEHIGQRHQPRRRRPLGDQRWPQARMEHPHHLTLQI